MKIMIIGATGQLGWELVSQFACNPVIVGRQCEIVTVDRTDLDLTDLPSINGFLARVRPRFIVNASAYTAVDNAESDQATAYAVNDFAVREIARYCDERDCRLIHVSTDYVFEGLGTSPFVESDPANPKSVYGSSKLAGEDSIRHVLTKHIILRTSWVFGVHGKNFVKTMLKLADSKSELAVVADQIGGPTSARSIARAILSIITQLADAEDDNRWGTYHFSGLPFVAWADFARVIFDQASSLRLIASSPNVIPVSTDEYPTQAPRPMNSRLDSSRIIDTFGLTADDWRTSLHRTLSELKEEGAE